MTRRTLLFAGGAIAAAPAKADPRIPTDESALNSFAEQYNTYVEGLRAGLVNLKQWERVSRAWRRLTGGVDA